MHQSLDPIVARFTFAPDRAGEFLEDGQLVTQIDCVDIDEVMEYVTQFQSALTDVSAIINGKVVNLSDYSEEA